MCIGPMGLYSILKQRGGFVNPFQQIYERLFTRFFTGRNGLWGGGKISGFAPIL